MELFRCGELRTQARNLPPKRWRIRHMCQIKTSSIMASSRIWKGLELSHLLMRRLKGSTRTVKSCSASLSKATFRQSRLIQRRRPTSVASTRPQMNMRRMCISADNARNPRKGLLVCRQTMEARIAMCAELPVSTTENSHTTVGIVNGMPAMNATLRTKSHLMINLFRTVLDLIMRRLTIFLIKCLRSS